VAIFNMDFIMNENFIYGKAQAGVASTCWVISYATMVVYNCRKSKMNWMVWTK
jgi:hypothetical protein